MEGAAKYIKMNNRRITCNQGSNESDKMQINCILNEDCLIQIFRFLAISDKLNIPLVCQKWKNISRTYWNNVEILSIKKDLLTLCSFNDEENFKGNITILTKILKICGHYLNTIAVYNFNRNIDYLHVQEEISKYCRNAHALEIFGNKNEPNFNVEIVNLFLSKLLNITSVHFKNLNLKSSSFKYFKNINELLITGCTLKNINFDDLRNLTKFEILLQTVGLVQIINALASSNCESINDLTIICYENFESYDKLAEFLSKQNKLCQLYFSATSMIDIRTLNSLSCNLEKINFLVLDESLLRFIPRFQNLKKLHCKIKYDLTDNCIENITECQSLEDLSISYSNYKLTSIGEICFNKLKNIKSIILSGSDNKNLNNILSNLQNCKNLEYIEISGINTQRTVYKIAPNGSNEFDIKNFLYETL